MALGDYRIALEMREIIRNLVTAEIERQRPSQQMATVTAIDRTNRACSVTFPGDITSVSVAMGSVQPSVVGQVVRVEGTPGDRYISDVMGPAYEPLEDRLISANQGITLPEDFDTEGIKGKGWEQLRLSLRSQGFGLTGPIMRSVTSTTIGWTGRFISISTGKSATVQSSGYYDLNMPADGTVIPGFGGNAGATVASGLIPFNAWDALYYVLPYGSNNVTVDANYKLASYTGSFVPPDSWLLIALRNGDTGKVLWLDGRDQDYWHSPTLLNSWATYGNSFAPPGYCKEHGIVRLRGLVTGGNVSAASTANIMVLPVGYRPDYTQLFVTEANAAIGRIDVMADGSVRALQGVNTWFSLDSIQFKAMQ